VSTSPSQLYLPHDSHLPTSWPRLYSDALKASHLIWDEASLDQWLADPEKLVPGQRMWVNVPEAAARRDLIAYLKQSAAEKK
jgi:cytochrome c